MSLRKSLSRDNKGEEQQPTELGKNQFFGLREMMFDYGKTGGCQAHCSYIAGHESKSTAESSAAQAKPTIVM